MYQLLNFSLGPKMLRNLVDYSQQTREMKNQTKRKEKERMTIPQAKE